VPVRLKAAMNILIVDDHVLFREGLVGLLANQPDLAVVGEAGSASEAITKTRDLKPDLVLIDLHLPDGDGLEVIKIILSRRPETKVVVLTINDSEDLFISAIRNGAVGYLHKKMPLAKLLLSLRAIGRGEAALSRTMASRLVAEFQRMGKTSQSDKSELDVLTPREMEVLELLGSNASNHEIADRLVIAENTVKVHVHNILEKLDFQNRYQAGRFARRLRTDSRPNGISDSLL
jgi:two-component system nitrate/nitrite response regulator NarL